MVTPSPVGDGRVMAVSLMLCWLQLLVGALRLFPCSTCSTIKSVSMCG